MKDGRAMVDELKKKLKAYGNQFSIENDNV